jgi:hypothetical protein
MENVGILMDILNSLRHIVFLGQLIYFPVLVCCTKKNLASLVHMYILIDNTMCSHLGITYCYERFSWTINLN